MALPIVMTPAGVQPQDPNTIRADVIAEAVLLAPGLTTELPGSLVEDMASTATGAAVVCDQAVVESVNNVTPLGANEFVLNNLGICYGVPQGVATNTSVYVVFSSVTYGYFISPGFIISDGSHQYVVQDGGTISGSGQSVPLYCLATTSGSWAIPAATVTTVVTATPGATVTVTNPNPGTPSAGAETVDGYRARVLQAGNANSIGTIPYLRTQIEAISGVQARLVSIRQANGGYELLVGGGDPYLVAGAIYQGLFNLNDLVGSIINITAFTAANPGVVTTDINHGYVTGDSVTISSSNPSTYDGTYTITLIDEKSFSVGVDTSAFGAYVGDAIATPNNRNITVTVTDYPDTYNVTYVDPPLQTVTIALTWNTSATNVISSTAVANAATPDLIAYINAIQVGQPINVFELQNTFQTAIASIIPPDLITKMDFTVSINGIPTSPAAGTGIISGDPESYFYAAASGITITRA